MKLSNKMRDITGMRFGQLVAKEMVGKSVKGAVLWKCLCDCGKEHTTKLAELIRKEPRATKSCGHGRKGQRKPIEAVGLNSIYCAAKANAKYRQIEFNLTKGQFKPLALGNCHYCNKTPSNIFKINNVDNNVFLYSGIDRVDSDKGYITGNVISCCGRCNSMKMEEHYIKFLKQIYRIYHNKNLEELLGNVDLYEEK